MTTDTPSSHAEEIPTPRTDEAEQERLHSPTGRYLKVVDVNFARQLERELFRLSAEREKERPVANRDVPTLFPTLQHEIESLRATLAERDKELAEERADVQTIISPFLKRESELEAQLLAAQTVNAKMREALEDMAEAFDSDTARRFYGEYWTMLEIGACSQARKALALSPYPTLLDEVKRDKEELEALQIERVHDLAGFIEIGKLVGMSDGDNRTTIEGVRDYLKPDKCPVCGPQIETLRAACRLTHQSLRQSTRETEEKV